VIGVAVSEDSVARVKRFVTENKLTYTFVMDGDGSRVAVKYNFDSIPTLFVIDGAGVVRFTHVGYYRGPRRSSRRR